MLMNWMPMDRLISEHEHAHAHAHETNTTTQGVVPRVDVVDEGDAYQLIVEMPGVSKDSLSVHLEAEDLLLRLCAVRDARSTPNDNAEEE